jgi:hypothetical protein
MTNFRENIMDKHNERAIIGIDYLQSGFADGALLSQRCVAGLRYGRL